MYYIFFLGVVRICGPYTQDVFNLVRETKLLFKTQLEKNQGLSHESDERRERMGGKK